MDYMAVGKPCVAYDLRESRVSAGEAALYARPNDEMDLARQLVKLIHNPALRAQLGEAGRQRVHEQLAWHHQKGFLLEAYDRLDAHSSGHL